MLLLYEAREKKAETLSNLRWAEVRNVGGASPFDAKIEVRVACENGGMLPPGELLLLRCVEDRVDLDDVVLEQALDLHHRARRIRRASPDLGLHAIDDAGIAMEIAEIDRDTHAVVQRGALGLGQLLDVREGATDACLGIGRKRVVLLVALDTGQEDEVPGARAQSPGSDWSGHARWRADRLDAIGRGRVRSLGKRRCCEQQRRAEDRRPHWCGFATNGHCVLSALV